MKDAIEKMKMKGITSVYDLTKASPGFTQIKTADPLEKKFHTIGEKGEIICRGFNVMKVTTIC